MKLIFFFKQVMGHIVFVLFLPVVLIVGIIVFILVLFGVKVGVCMLVLQVFRVRP